jgi:hypothetical protein
MADRFPPDDPDRMRAEDADPRGARELDNRLQVDPELEEGRVNGGRMAAYAVGVLIVLAAVFFGMNRATKETAGTAPPTQTTQSQPAGPAAAPRPNTPPGTTTGTANRPPQSDNAGSDSDRAAKPADNNGAPPPAHDNDQR